MKNYNRFVSSGLVALLSVVSMVSFSGCGSVGRSQGQTPAAAASTGAGSNLVSYNNQPLAGQQQMKKMPAWLVTYAGVNFIPQSGVVIETGSNGPGCGNLVVNGTDQDLLLEINGRLVCTTDPYTGRTVPVVVQPNGSHPVWMCFNGTTVPFRAIVVANFRDVSTGKTPYDIVAFGSCGMSFQSFNWGNNRIGTYQVTKGNTASVLNVVQVN